MRLTITNTSNQRVPVRELYGSIAPNSVLVREVAFGELSGWRDFLAKVEQGLLTYTLLLTQEEATLATLFAAREVNSVTPTAVQGGVSVVGVSTASARSDHAHAHGNQTVPTLHALATPSAHGFLSSVDKATIDTVLTEQSELLVQPEGPITGNQSTRSAQTTYEGASFRSIRRMQFNRIIVRNTAVNTPGTLRVAIYQRTGVDAGSGGALASLIADVQVAPTSSGTLVLTPSQGLVTLAVGTFYVLFGRSSATGSVTMRVYPTATYDLLTDVVDMGTHPTHFSTTISVSGAPPATFDPRASPTGSAVTSTTNTAVVLRLKRV